MKRGAATRARVRRVRGGRSEEAEDVVTTEEPLEIQVVETKTRREVPHSLAVTMRTPGDDFALAAGFLFTEGILRTADDFWRIEYCVPEDVEQEYNVVSVVLKESVPLDLSRTLRSFYTTSSCGVCGKATLDAVRVRAPPPLPPGRPRIRPADLRAWPDRLARGQREFARTGGIHAAGLFREDGRLEGVREDIGRHNAVDKLVGQRLLDGTLPLGDRGMLVSGRASFEIVQKALAAGIPFVAAVGAPSSLAVDLAREFGMTLVGFLRDDAYNVYAGPERITGGRPVGRARGPRGRSRS